MSTDSRQGGLTPFIAILFPAFASLQTITHPDFWIHIALGRAGIVRNETFSLASEGGAYVDVHWLYNGLTAGLFAAGGSPWVILVHTLAVSIGFALLILAARRYATGLPVAFAVVLSTWLMLVKLDARPILLAMPFIALMIYTLETKPAGPRQWIVLGIGQWFWMGLHPSFLLGPLLCILYAFSRKGEATHPPPTLKQCLIPTLAALGVTFLNPYGPQLHIWILSHSPVIFMPISLTNLSVVSDLMGAGRFQSVLYVALAIGGSGLLLVQEKLPRAPTVAAILAAFLSVITMGRISYHLLAVFGFLFFVISFQSFGMFIRRYLNIPPVQLSYAGRGALALLLLGSLAPVVSGSFFQRIGSASRLGLGLNQPVVTDQAIEFMASNEFPEELLHLPLDGGKIISSLPHRKIFIDSRRGAYRPTLFIDVSQALVRGDRDVWSRLDERFNPGAVLLNLTVPGSQHGLRMLLENEEWELAYFDGISAIVMRKQPEGTPRTPNRKSQLAGLQQIETAKNQLVDAFTKQKRPPLPLRVAGSGALFLILDRYPQANALLELAYAAAPGNTEWLYQLAISRFNIQDIDGTLEALTEIVSRQPNHAISWLWLARVYETRDLPDEAGRAYRQGYALNPELADQVKHTWGLQSGL